MRVSTSGRLQPRRAQARLNAEGAGWTRISSGEKVARERRADPVAEGVAGREHAHPPSRPGAKLLGDDGERARPFEALAPVRRDHREVAGAADEGLGRIDRVAGGRAEPVEAVLADPDDGEPRAHVIPRPRSR